MNMKTVLKNDSNFNWTVPTSWRDSIILHPQEIIEVEGAEGSIFEPYSELKRYFTQKQLYEGETKGIWRYSVDCKKRKGFQWNIDEDGQYDFVMMNNGDFEIEIFGFDFSGEARQLAPMGIKVVIRDIPVTSWLRRYKSVEIKPRKQAVARYDSTGKPDTFHLEGQVFYEKRSREELKKIEGDFLQWKKDNLIVGVE